MNLQITLAVRYLAGRKLRTVLTTLAVVFGVLVIFGMNIILPTMLAALQANAMAAQGVVDLTIVHETGGVFPQELQARVQTVDGVRAAAGYLERAVNLPADFVDKDPATPDAITVLTLMGIDPFAARTIRTYPLLAGRFLQSGDGPVAVISQSLADAVSAHVGDHIAIPSVNGLADLTVVGILLPRLNAGIPEVLVSLPEAQALTAQPGKINAIGVTLNSSDEAQRARILEVVKTALGTGFTTASLPGGEEMVPSLRLAQAAFSLFGLLALFMGAFIIFNTFRTVVTERQRDIGLLRAIGASRRTIIGMILAEGLLQGLVGTALGLLFGYLFGAGVLWAAGPLMEQFLNLKLGAPVISLETTLVSILLGVGVTVVAGVVPALNASRVTPLEALRPSMAQIDYRRQAGWGFVAGLFLIGLALLVLFSNYTFLVAPGVIVFLVGLVLVAPALIRPVSDAFGRLIALIYARQGIGELAQGNLARQPSRAAVTASATMIGLAVVVAAGGLITSLAGGMSDVMRKSLYSDYLFVPPSVALWSSNVGAGHSLADRLRRLDGVADVSTLRYTGSVVRTASTPPGGQIVSLLGIDPTLFPKVSGLRFQQGDEAAAYQELLKGHALIANGAFLSATGAKVGDTLQLATPGGQAFYRIAAMASDLLDVKVATAYISQADMLADFGAAEDVFVQLNLKPGADTLAAQHQIKAVAADYPQFHVVPGKLFFDQLEGEFNAAFAAIYILMALLAVPSLIAMLNTLAIGVIERTREIGVLRAVGATQKQIRSMVIAEALLLAAIGAVFGILCGLYLGFVFVNAMNSIFPLGYYFPVVGILAAVSVGLLLGALAAVIPARQAARLNIVDALRYE